MSNEKKKNRIVFFIMIIVFILMLGMVTGIYYLNKDTDVDNEKITTTSVVDQTKILEDKVEEYKRIYSNFYDFNKNFDKDKISRTYLRNDIFKDITTGIKIDIVYPYTIKNNDGVVDFTLSSVNNKKDVLDTVNRRFENVIKIYLENKSDGINKVFYVLTNNRLYIYVVDNQKITEKIFELTNEYVDLGVLNSFTNQTVINTVIVGISENKEKYAITYNSIDLNIDLREVNVDNMVYIDEVYQIDKDNNLYENFVKIDNKFKKFIFGSNPSNLLYAIDNNNYIYDASYTSSNLDKISTLKVKYVFEDVTTTNKIVIFEDDTFFRMDK